MLDDENEKIMILPDYQTTRLPDYQTTRLPDYQTTRLPDYQTTRDKYKKFVSFYSALFFNHIFLSKIFCNNQENPWTVMEGHNYVRR